MADLFVGFLAGNLCPLCAWNEAAEQTREGLRKMSQVLQTPLFLGITS